MRKVILLLWVTSITFCLLFFGCKKDEYKDLDCSGIRAQFSTEIQPILNTNCVKAGCHNAGSPNGDYSSYNGIKMKVDNGSVDKRVLKDKSMPPTGALSLDDRKKIKCWINSGAQNN